MKRYEIKLESEARLELEKQLKLHTTEYRLAERAKIILLSADGMSLEAIASKLDCSQRRICKWRRRYCENGLAGLQEMQRPGRPCTISPETVEKVITGAVSGGQVSSCRRMARATGISPSTVQRIWARNDIKPQKPPEHGIASREYLYSPVGEACKSVLFL